MAAKTDMPRLTRKADLLARFEEAIRLSGWNVLYLTHAEGREINIDTFLAELKAEAKNRG